MNCKFPQLLLSILIGCLIARDQSPYLETANELLVRRKLADKLPDVFDDKKFLEIVGKIDETGKIESRNHENRLLHSDPELHWCLAQTYLLAGRNREAADHYRRYKIQTLAGFGTIHELFQSPLDELEIEVENKQAQLAHSIYRSILEFKNVEDDLNADQVADIQNQLNSFNEFYPEKQSLEIDGLLGPITKTAFYDFEENNPYLVHLSAPESLPASVEISSVPNFTPVAAEDENTPPTRTVTISGDPIPLNTKIIIDANKIQSIPGNSIAEVLDYVLGVKIKRRGAADVLANISTFGGTGEQTLVLVDGLKISNQQTLYHDLDLPVNLDDIDRIEVYRNAAARKYGTGAVSGVVNIITKNGRDRDTYISTEFGDYSLMNGNMVVNIPIGRSYHNFSLGGISSEGYLTNTDFLKRTFYYKYSLEDGKTTTNFSFGFMERGNGIKNHLSSIYSDQYERNSTKFFNSKIMWDFGNLQLESNTHWFDHRDEFSRDKNLGGWKNYGSTEIGFNFASFVRNRFGRTSSGITYNRETNSNTVVSDITRDHYSLHIQNDFTFKNIDLNLGLSGNYYSDYGWFSAPGYQLVYHINNNANIYYKFDHGFRIPSFYEMYANDHIYAGNKDLKGETVNSYEYGMQLFGAPMNLTTSFFYKNSENVIDWYSSSGTIPVLKPENIPSVLTSGHNVHVELFPKIIKYLTFIDRFELGYAYLDIENNGSQNSYRNVSNYLKHQLIFGTQYKLPFNISRSWYIRYEQPTSYDNRVIFDTQVKYQIWKIESTLNINNVFNVQYEDVEDVSLPGRWIRFSLRYNL
ncbi:MAG: TonB-dependent receptor [Candidatus Marinimicrobia bacterium]|nr:TonB-dependent receptor [Candidatus Neomarinimicrobiota bacterium]